MVDWRRIRVWAGFAYYRTSFVNVVGVFITDAYLVLVCCTSSNHISVLPIVRSVESRGLFA